VSKDLGRHGRDSRDVSRVDSTLGPDKAARRDAPMVTGCAVAGARPPPLGPGQLDRIVKVVSDQALEDRPDQLPMAAQHRLTDRQVQQQGNQCGGVGVHAKDPVGLDGEAAALGQWFDGLRTARRGAAQDPGDRIVAELGQEPVGFSAAWLGQGSEAVGPVQACLSLAWA
jgi:hypothetical protein